MSRLELMRKMAPQSSETRSGSDRSSQPHFSGLSQWSASIGTWSASPGSAPPDDGSMGPSGPAPLNPAGVQDRVLGTYYNEITLHNEVGISPDSHVNRLHSLSFLRCRWPFR